MRAGPGASAHAAGYVTHGTDYRLHEREAARVWAEVDDTFARNNHGQAPKFSSHPLTPLSRSAQTTSMTTAHTDETRALTETKTAICTHARPKTKTRHAPLTTRRSGCTRWPPVRRSSSGSILPTGRGLCQRCRATTSWEETVSALLTAARERARRARQDGGVLANSMRDRRLAGYPAVGSFALLSHQPSSPVQALDVSVMS